MTGHQKLLRRGTWIIVLAIAVARLLTPSLVHAQSSNCAGGAVDYYDDTGDTMNDIEQTVCIYYDGEYGISTYVETDNDSYADWQELDSLWIFGVGSEAQVWGNVTSEQNSDLIYDSGMVYGDTSDAGGDSVILSNSVPWGYYYYGLQGLYSICGQIPEEYDQYGCSWNSQYEPDGTQLGLSVALLVPSYPSQLSSPTLTLSTSETPATLNVDPVTFTVTVSNGPDTGYVFFYNGGNYCGSALLSNSTAIASCNDLAVGDNPITAGWADWGITSSTLDQKMRMVPTVGVSCSPGTTNYGSSSTCTATVNGYYPTGTISYSYYSYDGIVWSTSTLSNGSASASSPIVLHPGTFTIVANYSGDDFNVASSGFHNIDRSV